MSFARKIQKNLLFIYPILMVRKTKSMSYINIKFYRKITERESEIINLIAQEHTNKEIAQRLYISIDTVKTHRKNLLAKLMVSNAAGLVRRGIELELIKITRAS